jgi:hypothetical protein
MGASNSNSKQIKFYSLKAKADETNKPHFGFYEKVNEKWQITETFDTISGSLVGAEIAVKEYQGAKQNIFKIKLADGEEISQIEMTHNSISYSIINTLSSLAHTLGELKIKVYKSSKDGKHYGNAFIENEGQKMAWAFQPSEAPKRLAVTLPSGKPMLKDGIQVYDDSETREFYENVFTTKIVNLVKGTTDVPTQRERVIENQKAKNEVNEHFEDDDNSLPF